MGSPHSGQKQSTIRSFLSSCLEFPSPELCRWMLYHNLDRGCRCTRFRSFRAEQGLPVTLNHSEVILIAPWWPTQPWFPHLIQLCVDQPCFLHTVETCCLNKGMLCISHKLSDLPSTICWRVRIQGFIAGLGSYIKDCLVMELLSGGRLDLSVTNNPNNSYDSWDLV